MNTQYRNSTVASSGPTAARRALRLARGWLLAGAGALAALSGDAFAGPLPVAKEHEIKAAFVYNFVKFVEWPASAIPAADAPMVIGVVGTGPVKTALEGAVANRKVNGHDLVVKSVDSRDALAGVHVAFFADEGDAQLPVLMPALASAPVLTVGESDAFAAQGGAIRLVLEGDKVRFEINIGAAERAGLKVSAQLQKLARSVTR